MKQIFSNGKTFEVRDIGEVVFSLQAGNTPLPIITKEIYSDEEARAICKDLLGKSIYENTTDT